VRDKNIKLEKKLELEQISGVRKKSVLW